MNASLPATSIKLFLLTCLLLLSQALLAEQKEDMGDYELHYNVIPSTFLTPEVAKQYQIQRSKGIAVVNLSLIKKPNLAVSALVQGMVINDIQQSQTLNFNQVKEGKSIYYLAQVPFSNGELLTFDVTLYPVGTNQPLTFRFSQNIFN